VPLATELLAQITEVVGSEHVLEGDDLTAGFSVDWTGRYRGHTPAVVRPGDIDEVAAVLAPVSYTHLRAHET